jgi:hypothetical protein
MEALGSSTRSFIRESVSITVYECLLVVTGVDGGSGVSELLPGKSHLAACPREGRVIAHRGSETRRSKRKQVRGCRGSRGDGRLERGSGTAYLGAAS